VIPIDPMSFQRASASNGVKEVLQGIVVSCFEASNRSSLALELLKRVIIAKISMSKPCNWPASVICLWGWYRRLGYKIRLVA